MFERKEGRYNKLITITIIIIKLIETKPFFLLFILLKNLFIPISIFFSSVPLHYILEISTHILYLFVQKHYICDVKKCSEIKFINFSK